MLCEKRKVAEQNAHYFCQLVINVYLYLCLCMQVWLDGWIKRLEEVGKEGKKKQDMEGEREAEKST